MEMDKGGGQVRMDRLCVTTADRLVCYKLVVSRSPAAKIPAKGRRRPRYGGKSIGSNTRSAPNKVRKIIYGYQIETTQANTPLINDISTKLNNVRLRIHRLRNSYV